MPWSANKDAYYAIAGEAIAQDEAVTIDPADNKAYKANANSGEENLPCLGFAATAVALGEGLWIKTSGCIKPAPNSLTTGIAYLANTDGDISASAGDTSQVVGHVFPGVDGVDELRIECAMVAHVHPAQS